MLNLLQFLKSDWFCMNYVTTTLRKSASLPLNFPRFAPALCNHFKFWLVHCIVRVVCDWLERSQWFWFCNTQLKIVVKWLAGVLFARSWQLAEHLRRVSRRPYVWFILRLMALYQRYVFTKQSTTAMEAKTSRNKLLVSRTMALHVCCTS